MSTHRVIEALDVDLFVWEGIVVGRNAQDIGQLDRHGRLQWQQNRAEVTAITFQQIDPASVWTPKIWNMVRHG